MAPAGGGDQLEARAAHGERLAIFDHALRLERVLLRSFAFAEKEAERCQALGSTRERLGKLVEAAGIEDMQGWCNNSLRDATLPRTSLRFFENLLPSPPSWCRAVPPRTAASWQPGGNALSGPTA
jgi:hypothetical protein